MITLVAPAGLPDLGAFCARLLRLDPATLVRLGGGAVWARLPFDVLVTRPVRTVALNAPLAVTTVEGATIEAEATYRADELLAWLGGGSAAVRRDAEWRGALPPAAGRTLESLPAAEVTRIAEAAAETLRGAPAGVGERRVRDALLDHVAVTVTAGEETVLIQLRLVQGLARMGFVGAAPVAVLRAGPWTGLAGEFGTVWYRPTLGLRPL